MEILGYMGNFLPTTKGRADGIQNHMHSVTGLKRCDIKASKLM